MDDHPRVLQQRIGRALGHHRRRRRSTNGFEVMRVKENPRSPAQHAQTRAMNASGGLFAKDGHSDGPQRQGPAPDGRSGALVKRPTRR